MTNPNRTATIGTVAFKDLKPGDKFALKRPYIEIVGACVQAPVLTHSRKWYTFWKPTTYKAKCIELHQYQGAVEWNPEEPHDMTVELLEVTGRR